MIRIVPYNRFSKSAKAIVKLLGKNVIRRKLPYNQPGRSQIILNWGCSNIEFDYSRNKFFNKPEAIQIASNKKLAFDVMKQAGVSVPDYTIDSTKAKEWLDAGFKVLCRHKLRGHSGDGIQVLRSGEVVPYAPLYVKYHKKKHEFRVHVFNGEVIDYVEKKKKLSVESDDSNKSLIRSHDNGWVFCRNGILVLDSVKEEAIKAVRALGLDFGAVDLIISKDVVICLEVNTAPGLEGSTLEKYAQAIRGLNETRRNF